MVTGSLARFRHNFIKENDAVGYKVFARPQGDPARGQIVVLADSPITSLAELRGREVRFPHVAAFLGYHLTADAFMRLGLEVKPVFAGTQEGAMGQLKARRTEAAGVNADIMRSFAKREGVEYRVLWNSEPFLSLALSAHPSVPASQIEAVKSAFLRMADDPIGARTLQASADTARERTTLVFIPAIDAEFDNMRRFYRNTSLPIELH